MSSLDGAPKQKIPGISGDFAVNAGRLELPTNGLKGHCSAIELRVRTAELILSLCGRSVNSYSKLITRKTPAGLLLAGENCV